MVGATWAFIAPVLYGKKKTQGEKMGKHGKVLGQHGKSDRGNLSMIHKSSKREKTHQFTRE